MEDGDKFLLYMAKIAQISSAYDGGIAQLSLAVEHPDFEKEFCSFLDRLSVERAQMLGLIHRPIWKTVMVNGRQTELAKISNAELGYPDGCSVPTTLTKALKLGWKVCPIEATKKISRNYHDQPIGEVLVIPAEIQMSLEGEADMKFFVIRYDGLLRRLDSGQVRPDKVHSGDVQFVFQIPPF